MQFALQLPSRRVRCVHCRHERAHALLGRPMILLELVLQWLDDESHLLFFCLVSVSLAPQAKPIPAAPVPPAPIPPLRRFRLGDH